MLNILYKNNSVNYKIVSVEGEDFYLVPVKDIEVKERKVAFVVGHIPSKQGFYSTALGATEYEFWLKYANDNLKSLGEVFTHEDIVDYTLRQSKMSKLTKDFDLVFELHFNAFNSVVDGVECLVWKGNKKMLEVGNYFCREMVKGMSYDNRYAKDISTGNGAGFLEVTKGDAILLEPFFGDNTLDCAKFDIDIYTAIIKKTIDFYYEQS